MEQQEKYLTQLISTVQQASQQNPMHMPYQKILWKILELPNPLQSSMFRDLIEALITYPPTHLSTHGRQNDERLPKPYMRCSLLAEVGAYLVRVAIPLHQKSHLLALIYDRLRVDCPIRTLDRLNDNLTSPANLEIFKKASIKYKKRCEASISKNRIGKS